METRRKRVSTKTRLYGNGLGEWRRGSKCDFGTVGLIEFGPPAVPLFPDSRRNIATRIGRVHLKVSQAPAIEREESEKDSRGSAPLADRSQARLFVISRLASRGQARARFTDTRPTRGPLSLLFPSFPTADTSVSSFPRPVPSLHPRFSRVRSERGRDTVREQDGNKIRHS